MATMSEPEDKDSDAQLKVPLDVDFKRDLEKASKTTGIWSRPDLIRYCVRKVAREAA